MPTSDSKIKLNSKSFSPNYLIARQSLHAPQNILSMKRKISFTFMAITFHKKRLNKILWRKRQSLPTLSYKMKTCSLRGRFKKHWMKKFSISQKEILITSTWEKLTRSRKNSALKKKLRVTTESNLQKLGNKQWLKSSKIKPKWILRPQRLSKSHPLLHRVPSK